MSYINHGIGKYLGINKLEIGGASREYLEIEYAVPIVVCSHGSSGDGPKYIGLEDSPPRINRLGGSDCRR